MTSTALTTYSAMDIEAKKAYIGLLATAGDMIPRGLKNPDGSVNPGKVFLALETGAMLGIHPASALANINVIDGKAGLSAALMSGLMRGAGHRLSVHVEGSVEAGDLRAVATLERLRGGMSIQAYDEPITATYSLRDDARRAGLCSYGPDKDGVWTVVAKSQNGKPTNWEKFPEDMCVARVTSRIYRRGATDAGMGAVYLTEELQEGVDMEEGREMVAAGAAIESATREADDEWVDAIADAETLDALRDVWERARHQGVLADKIGDGTTTVRDALEARAAEFAPDSETPKGDPLDEAQAATIAEWAETLGWNARALMAHIRKVVGDHVNDVLDLTEDEAARVIVSLRATSEVEEPNLDLDGANEDGA